MWLKFLVFTFLQIMPLLVWSVLLKKKNVSIDYRLVVSFFFFGTWFGMMGELFLFQLGKWLINFNIWEYRVLPIHEGITSAYGPIMWGLAGVYVCFHHHFSLFNFSKNSGFKNFISESSYLLVSEVYFNLLGFLIFKDYFFYYFVPDMWHWSSLTNLPFWWVGYRFMVKAAKVFYKEELFNFCIAAFILIVIFTYQR